MPAAWETTGAAAEATLPAAAVTGAAAEVTVPAAEDTAPAVPETAETREPPRPAGAWVAAEAGAASSTPMPNARHRPLTTTPKAHNSTFRTGTHQPFMPGTLVT